MSFTTKSVVRQRVNVYYKTHGIRISGSITKVAGERWKSRRYQSLYCPTNAHKL